MTDTKTPTLAELAKSTPTQALTPLDAHLAAFLASTPPPPLADAKQAVEERLTTITGRHDLEELQKQMLAAYQRDLDQRRKQDMLKPLYWPTAMVVGLFVVAEVVLISLGKDVPSAITGVVGAAGIVIAGAMTKLTGGQQ